MIPFKEYDSLIQGITFEMNFDMNIIQRTGYTVIDLLSDVGGLQGILISGMTLLLNIWNYD